LTLLEEFILVHLGMAAVDGQRRSKSHKTMQMW